MQRIYLPNTEFSDILEIRDGDLYHQLTRVLRARIDQEMVFFDGKEIQDYIYRVIHINKNSISFKRTAIISKDSELKTHLSLYQALPNKLSKIESLVQKCSEVGYREIIFFESERTQKLVLSDNKKQRIQKIVVEAIEQCGGNTIPKILYVDFLPGKNELNEIMSYVCHTESEKSLFLSDISNHTDINVIVGPEGGFSENEIELLNGYGVKSLHLGNRILRCETVGEVVGFYISQK